MAHWAELDENNIVLRVSVGDNDDPNEGYDWIIENLGGRWVKTSYNTYGGKHSLGGTPFRFNYAGEGFFYDEERDAFIPPKLYPSWILNEETCLWNPPIPKPENGIWFWDEDIQQWIELEKNVI